MLQWPQNATDWAWFPRFFNQYFLKIFFFTYKAINQLFSAPVLVVEDSFQKIEWGCNESESWLEAMLWVWNLDGWYYMMMSPYSFSIFSTNFIRHGSRVIGQKVQWPSLNQEFHLWHSQLCRFLTLGFHSGLK